MKRYLILIVLILAPSLAFAGPLQNALKGVIARKNSSACTASYGSELHVDAAADAPTSGDSDAMTGWSNTGLATFDSITTDPQTGTYHITAIADSDGDKMYRNITGLSASTVYKLAYGVRHNGTGGTWCCGIRSNNSPFSSCDATLSQSLLVTDTAWTTRGGYFIYSSAADYLVCSEMSATNDGGIYEDTFTLSAATLCYGAETVSGNGAALTGEVDATTGFSTVTGGTVDSIDTSTPHNGTYHISVTADGTANAGAYIDLSAILTAGTKYMLRYWIKGDGTNTWRACIGSSTTNCNYANLSAVSSATYEEFGTSLVFNATTMRYFVVQEANAGNTGTAFIDGITIMPITGE